MSFIDKIKDMFSSKPAEPDLIHPIFGNMISEVCGDENDFWQSEINFEPLNTEICINVNAGAKGPSDAQVEFYKEFSTNYQKEFNFVAPALIKEFEDWFNEKLTGDFVKNFLFVGITIPKDGDRNNFWELSFDCLADRHGHMFTAEIENNEITNIRADG